MDAILVLATALTTLAYVTAAAAGYGLLVAFPRERSSDRAHQAAMLAKVGELLSSVQADAQQAREMQAAMVDRQLAVLSELISAR